MSFEVIFKLFLALVLGGIIGLERKKKKKEAGFQTYSLVCLGSCLFTILGFSLLETTKEALDILRIIQAVAIGMGFIGAGSIVFYQDKIKGLTTAAGLWATSGIGIAIGASFYFLAIFSTFLILLILAGFSLIEKRIFEEE